MWLTSRSHGARALKLIWIMSRLKADGLTRGTLSPRLATLLTRIDGAPRRTVAAVPRRINWNCLRRCVTPFIVICSIPTTSGACLLLSAKIDMTVGRFIRSDLYESFISRVTSIIPGASKNFPKIDTPYRFRFFLRFNVSNWLKSIIFMFAEGNFSINLDLRTFKWRKWRTKILFLHYTLKLIMRCFQKIL